MGNEEVPRVRDHAWARGVLGLTDAPPAVPAHSFTEFDQVADGVRMRGLTIRGAASPVIPAYLLEPADDAGGPRVLALHQHNDEYHLGKGEVAGLHGDPDMAYGLELAQRGCTVLAADARGFEDRAPTTGNPRTVEHTLAWNLVGRGTSLAALYLTDLRDLLSWLEDRPSASPSIGAIGHSLGGTLALFLAAVDERVTAAVSSCGVGTLASVEDADVLHNPSWYVPGLRALGDTPAVASVLDRQRIHVCSGADDHLFPLDGIRAVVAGFRPGRADVTIRPGGHTFPQPERSLALDWLLAELAASPGASGGRPR